MSKLVGRIVRLQGWISRFSKVKSFAKQCQDPMTTQWAFLKALLERHQDTDFGKKYNFRNIKSIAEYRFRVPIHTWEDISPYVEQVKQGHQTALFPADEKLLMFATTSGTSSGQSKFIPVTQTSYDLWNKTWPHTWSHVTRECPKTFYGKGLYFPGDPAEGFFGKIPYGAITAKAYAAQNFIIRSIYPYPYQVSRIKSYSLRYYTIMRMALAQQVTFIPIANPSVSLALFDTAQRHRKQLIEDIRTGTLRHPEKLPLELIGLLHKTIRPDPKRADQLEKVFQDTGDFLPRDYWPGLQTMICFSGGSCQMYLDRVRKYIGNTKIFDFGLLASEARLSFPVSSTDRGGALTIESNFFEFIPENQIDQKDPEVLTLDQLSKGERYFVLFTNASGLYRYNISDLVEVIGFHGKVPLISFCNKGSHISSLTGEKITELQVVESVRKASYQAGYDLTQFIACPHWDEKLPYYVILKDAQADDNPETLQRLIDAIESELLKSNMEYASKRNSGRLGALVLKIVKDRGIESFQETKKLACRNLSQFKQAYLNTNPNFESNFQIQDTLISGTKRESTVGLRNVFLKAS